MDEGAGQRAADEERTRLRAAVFRGGEHERLHAAPENVVSDVEVVRVPVDLRVDPERERGDDRVLPEALPVRVQLADHRPIGRRRRSARVREVHLRAPGVDHLHALAVRERVDVAAAHHEAHQVSVEDAVRDAGRPRPHRGVGLRHVEHVDVRGGRARGDRRADDEPSGLDREVHGPVRDHAVGGGHGHGVRGGADVEDLERALDDFVLGEVRVAVLDDDPRGRERAAADRIAEDLCREGRGPGLEVPRAAVFGRVEVHDRVAELETVLPTELQPGQGLDDEADDRLVRLRRRGDVDRGLGARRQPQDPDLHRVPRLARPVRRPLVETHAAGHVPHRLVELDLDERRDGGAAGAAAG